jgi:twitching motility protein PilT
MIIEDLLKFTKEKGASDLHISSNAQPMMRVDGDMLKIDGALMMSSSDVMDIIKSITSEEQRAAFKQNLELDFSVQFGKQMRFRVNAFFNIYGPAAAFREIPLQIKSFEEIGAPEIIRSLTSCSKGLILVVGPTGNGKSTTLATFLDYINANQKNHIITIEDPVEFTHTNKKSLINQREVGSSTKSFANALRGALREDPDVILVGELRDIETIQLALTAAETGHLVLATLHTSSAAQTINRIIDVFPAHDKPLARSMFSSSIKAVISQKLIKKAKGGRCAAYEIMVANSSIRNLIREDKVPQINSIIELGKKSGMCLMKDSINELLTKGIISVEEAQEVLAFND